MLRPLRVSSGRGEPTNLGNWPLLIALIGGFAASAFAVGMIAVAVGREAALPASVAAALLLALLIADAGRRVPMLRRQTPKDVVALPPLLRALVWGLDTGTMVSTFRTSALTWAALLLALLSGGPPWVGLAYAAGFCLPLLASVAGPAGTGRHFAGGNEMADGVCASGLLLAQRLTVQRACRTLLLGALVIVGINAL